MWGKFGRLADYKWANRCSCLEVFNNRLLGVLHCSKSYCIDIHYDCFADLWSLLDHNHELLGMLVLTTRASYPRHYHYSLRPNYSMDVAHCLVA